MSTILNVRPIDAGSPMALAARGIARRASIPDEVLGKSRCDPSCKAWDLFERSNDGLLSVQACDECGHFSDDDAARFAQLAGLVVSEDARHYVTGYESEAVLDAVAIEARMKDSLASYTALERLRAFAEAGSQLAEAWHPDVNVGYPAFLHDFDDVIARIHEWRHTAEKAWERRALRRGPLDDLADAMEKKFPLVDGWRWEFAYPGNFTYSLGDVEVAFTPDYHEKGSIPIQVTTHQGATVFLGEEVPYAGALTAERLVEIVRPFLCLLRKE